MFSFVVIVSFALIDLNSSRMMIELKLLIVVNTSGKLVLASLILRHTTTNMISIALKFSSSFWHVSQKLSICLR